jgi:hypothetical protein
MSKHKALQNAKRLFKKNGVFFDKLRFLNFFEKQLKNSNLTSCTPAHAPLVQAHRLRFASRTFGAEKAKRCIKPEVFEPVNEGRSKLTLDELHSCN